MSIFSLGAVAVTCSRCLRELPRKIIFPAGVFLLKHREKGYILYDTGYSPAILKPNFKYWLYGLGTPVDMSEEERVDRLLEQKGIAPEDISYVILSHLHPDHIGGAAFFPKARFILTKTVFKTYQHAKLKDLIFKEFLPQDFESRLEVVEPQQVQEAFLYRKTVDLFGDGSIYLASVDGHAAGQACLFCQIIICLSELICAGGGSVAVYGADAFLAFTDPG